VRNRRGLRSALTREFRRAERYGGKLTVLAFDVDRFKAVNDMYGHAVGDNVLFATAQALKRGVREVDVVGRVGGEEFVVLAPETPSHDAFALGERLRKAVSERVVTTPAGGEVRVTVSCGIATLSDVHARTPEELLGYADSALYRAKALGRDRCEVAEVVLDENGKKLPPPAPMTQKMSAATPD
jgi:diguanylate cyclase (GGDEF)-like protein